MSRPTIVRPQSKRDVVLRLALTVTPEGATFDYNEGLVALKRSRDGFTEIFPRLMRLFNGVFVINITADGASLEEDVASVYTPTEWAAILNQETAFAKYLNGHFNQLMTAYCGMAVEPEHLEAIVRAAVECALQVYEDDRLAEDLRLPTIDQLEGMKFAGGCATCCFVDNLTGLLARFSHGDDAKPKLANGVVQIAGVNVRVLDRDDKLRVIVGYLAHENIFEHAFHDDLIARLQPLLTPEFIRPIIHGYLALNELARRTFVRRNSVAMNAYGFKTDDIATFADAKEAKIREELRRQ